ncbi:alcohol dehydrogenase superfamily protein [Lentinula lateritia]|uniref:Alcohol dehydrogenase superfamily protein n=1 Tax=Lentinula lateritia TaxID=40482 RepID=A0ABQ8V7X1_9AGAR|nr:alcohol dehydrogenase superfamily protein [Lentinula lateritia]
MVGLNIYPGSFPDEVVPCSDMAGEIIAVGDEAGRQWKKGDRVCANFAADHIAGDITPEIQKTAHGGAIHGVLTQYKAFSPHSLVAIPDHLSFEEASTLPCAALTAYNALMGPVPLKGGDTIVVLGTGGVSIHGLQIALASGAKVIVTSSSDEKLQIATNLGAHHVVNYKTTPNWHEEILKLTGGRGADHILEVGGPDSLEKSLKAVRMAGWVHAIGVIGGGTPTEVMMPTIQKACFIRGIQIGSIAQFKDMNRLLSLHPEVTRPVIDKVFPFEEALRAYEYLESQAHVGKVVIKVA